MDGWLSRLAYYEVKVHYTLYTMNQTDRETVANFVMHVFQFNIASILYNTFLHTFPEHI